MNFMNHNFSDVNAELLQWSLPQPAVCVEHPCCRHESDAMIASYSDSLTATILGGVIIIQAML